MSGLARKCEKIRYRTKAEAREAIAGMASKWSFVYKRAYWCPKCKAYHISAKPTGLTRKRKQW